MNGKLPKHPKHKKVLVEPTSNPGRVLPDPSLEIRPKEKAKEDKKLSKDILQRIEEIRSSPRDVPDAYW